MAGELSTAQKAKLIVTDPASGTVLDKASLVGKVRVDNPNLVVDESKADAIYIVAAIAGSSAVRVTMPDGRAGGLTVHIAHAPLVVDLDTPEPK